MGYHIDKNGVAAVTPNYLYSANGVVPHPLQKSGAIPHLASHSGQNPETNQIGHPWFGGNRTAVLIGK